MTQTTATGWVLTPAGWPVPGASVTIIDAAGAQAGRALAASDGSFAVSDLPPGPATVLVAAPGHQPSALTVTVPAAPSWELGRVLLRRVGDGALPEAGIWVIDPTHSTVQAQARHLGLSTVRGGFDDFGGMIVVDEDFSRSRTEVHLQAATVNTRNSQRDAHLRSADFLDVERFPTVSYVSDRVERAGDGWTVVGELTMAGQTRPVNLDMRYHGSGADPWGGTRIGFSATTQLRRDDFAMNWNQAVGLGIDLVGATLRVELEIEAVRQGL